MPRPPLPESAKRSEVATFRMTKREDEHLTKFYGSAVKGLRVLVQRDMAKRQTSDGAARPPKDVEGRLT